MRQSRNCKNWPKLSGSLSEELRQQQQQNTGQVLSICKSVLKVTVYTRTRTITITCTCCYDEIKGTQDLKIYSHADSQILYLQVCFNIHLGPIYATLSLTLLLFHSVSNSELVPLCVTLNLCHSLPHSKFMPLCISL